MMTPSPPPPADAPGPQLAEGIFLDTVLRPHRSLPPSGFVVLMAALAGVSFVAGMIFVLLGAWPVMGFFGLDVGLVYLAFRINYRSARRQERFRLADDMLTVERIGVRGDRRRWSFQAYWARVVLDEIDEDSNSLAIASHGRSLTVASFLGARERRAFAETLVTALARWKAQLTLR